MPKRKKGKTKVGQRRKMSAIEGKEGRAGENLGTWDIGGRKCELIKGCILDIS